MPTLQKANLGVPPSGAGGDDQRTANTRFNANVDVLSACVALGYNILSDNSTLAPSNVGARFGLSMGSGGKVVKLPLASSVSVNACVHFFNVGPSVAIGFQGGDGSQINLLNTGDWATYVSDGGTWWHVAERGRMLPDEIVSGNLSVVGKLTGVNSSNLLINGSGELGNTGWNGTTFGAVQGSYGEGPLFANSSAINTGTWVVDASNDIPCRAGVSLTVSAEIISMGLNAGRAYVKCEAFKSDGTYIGNVVATPANTTKLGYTFRSATGTTPAGTAIVRVSKVADAAPNIDAYGVAFRRIKLEGASGASLYSQEATLAYLGGAPALSGRPTFSGKVPWDSGNLAAPWHAGNFNPADYAKLTGADFSSRVSVSRAPSTGDIGQSAFLANGSANDGRIGLASYNWASAVQLRCSVNMQVDAVNIDATQWGKFAAAAFNIASDRAFKKDIRPLADGLDKVLRLAGVYYADVHTGAANVGLIAQDVQDVFPEVVNVIDTEGHLAIDYAKLVGPLIEAVKT
ncbi:tail fiber domain-containing protein, partial [Burkholderia cenocepacia]